MRNLFHPDQPWLYGNLSPLVNIDDVEKHKKLYVSYSIRNNRIFSEMENTTKEIAGFYKIRLDNECPINNIENKIKHRFKELVKAVF